MNSRILGIHHVTAIAGDAQANYDFYTAVLGLRLVKRTVNYDDPATYHFYFGDQDGSPGSILTFFPWPGARKGRIGAGQVAITSLSLNVGALEFWQERFERMGVEHDPISNRFGENTMAFRDPDGLQLELVEDAEVEDRNYAISSLIPNEAALRGIHSVTLWQRRAAGADSTLRDFLGYAVDRAEPNRWRYQTGASGETGAVDIVERVELPMGAMGTGTVHHVAFRTPDIEIQDEIRAELIEDGYHVSEVMDRIYFRSIYFREPGGVLFEVATDPPGFTVDEPHDKLGTALSLPPWLQGRKEIIEESLPVLKL